MKSMRKIGMELGALVAVILGYVGWFAWNHRYTPEEKALSIRLRELNRQIDAEAQTNCRAASDELFQIDYDENKPRPDRKRLFALLDQWNPDSPAQNELIQLLRIELADHPGAQWTEAFNFRACRTIGWHLAFQELLGKNPGSAKPSLSERKHLEAIFRRHALSALERRGPFILSGLILVTAAKQLYPSPQTDALQERGSELKKAIRAYHMDYPSDRFLSDGWMNQVFGTPLSRDTQLQIARGLLMETVAGEALALSIRHLLDRSPVATP